MNERQMLQTMAAQLERWAVEIQNNGWATNQVAPMRQLAQQINDFLGATTIQPNRTGAAITFDIRSCVPMVTI